MCTFKDSTHFQVRADAASHILAHGQMLAATGDGHHAGAFARLATAVFRGEWNPLAAADRAAAHFAKLGADAY